MDTERQLELIRQAYTSIALKLNKPETPQSIADSALSLYRAGVRAYHLDNGELALQLHEELAQSN